MEIVSEIAGTVVEVVVALGTEVDVDDALVILESMKMEIPVVATARGTVTSLQVQPGDTVNEGDPLVVIA